MAGARLPVLLNPSVKSCAHSPHAGAEDAARAKRPWGRFKLAAVSSFAFVEAAGPIYAGKLLRDALGLGPSHLPQDPVPQLSPGLDAAQKLASAEMVLRAVSMTDGFARVVLLAGHGANVTNNPHASALHCGACGGYRLRPEALAVKIGGLHVGQVVRMSISEAHAWIQTVPEALTGQKNEIARAILKEIRERLGFLVPEAGQAHHSR